MKPRVVYGQPVGSGEPQRYFTDLHRRTELAVSSGRFTRKQDCCQSDRQKRKAFKDTINYVLGDGWIYTVPVGRERH